MGDEAPKLYVHKPKKGQTKKVKGTDVKPSATPLSSFPASSAVSSYYSTESNTIGGGSGGGGGGGGGGGISKPPDVPKESFPRRYKYLWPMLLTVNLGIGAYLFMRTKKKDVPSGEETPVPASAPTTTTAIISIPPPTASAVTESVPVAQPVRVLDPIPEMRQRELFKWILEEKRKIKTNDPAEKKRIDEEKAILKQFIQAKSIPNI